MLIFIDESGIHKQDGQSTTALVYIKVENAGKVNEAILRAEKRLGIEHFHWNKQMWKIRQAFLEEILAEEFEVKLFIFQNPFTEEKMEIALRHLIVEDFIRTVVLDGQKPRRFVLRLKQILRQQKVRVKNIRMGNDKAFPGLRLADLFAGLVRSYANNSDNEDARKLYKTARIKITIQLMDGQVPGSLFL
jgi:hypothetical protein